MKKGENMETALDRDATASAKGFVVEWQMKEFSDPKSNFLSPIPRDQGVRVLLVAADAAGRDRLGGWLTEEGHDVIQCPGPGAPDYTCLGGRGQDCPLAIAADVVILDLNLASDAVLAGTPSWRLLDYYLARGHPVVAIAGPEQMGRFFLDDRVVTLDRPVDRDAVIEALDAASTRRSSSAEIGTFRLTPRRRVHRP